MVRLCVIGAGPSGMSVLYHVRRIKKEKPDVDIEVGIRTKLVLYTVIIYNLKSIFL